MKANKTIVTNKGCADCDKFTLCDKRVVIDGVKYLATEQTVRDMKCVHKVEDICVRCKAYKSDRCAYWKVIDGQRAHLGTMVDCGNRKHILKEMEGELHA